MIKISDIKNTKNLVLLVIKNTIRFYCCWNFINCSFNLSIVV